MHPSQIKPPSARRREDDIFTTRAFATSCRSGPLPLRGVLLSLHPPRLLARAGSRPFAFSRPNPNTFLYFKDERADLWLERGKPNAGASGGRGYKLSCFSIQFFRLWEAGLPARANKRRGAAATDSSSRSKRGGNLITGCWEICNFISPDRRRLFRRHDVEERGFRLKSPEFGIAEPSERAFA